MFAVFVICPIKFGKSLKRKEEKMKKESQ